MNILDTDFSIRCMLRLPMADNFALNSALHWFKNNKTLHIVMRQYVCIVDNDLSTHWMRLLQRGDTIAFNHGLHWFHNFGKSLLQSTSKAGDHPDLFECIACN